MARSILLLLVTISVGCGPGESNVSPAEPMEPRELEVESAGVAHFGNPDRMCDALAHVNLAPMPRTRWNPELTGGYDCTSDDLIVGPGYPLENTLQYYVRGADADRVEFVRLTADVFNPDESSASLERLALAAERLADQMDIPVSEDLRAALAEGEPGSFPAENYEITVAREPFDTGFSVIATIREA